MTYLFMGISVIVIIAALMYFKKMFFSSERNATETQDSVKTGFVNCPVCGNPLLPGQNLVSKVFRPVGSAPDQMCYIYGCPNCYPKCLAGVRRSCPVCHKDVAQEGCLISRMFMKTKSGKPHVIINGCGNCNRADS